MKRTANITLRTLALVAVTGSVIGVLTTASAADQIYACVNNSSGTIHIVGASASCANNEIRLVWSTAGPQGPQGQAGKDGADGTNGIDGISVTVVGSFTGNANGCPNGGAIFQAAGNVLAYVCNGSNGADGAGGTRAAGPCFDHDNRYVNCGNGTVTDTVTGLIWLQDAACLGVADWVAANQAAAALKHGDCGLTDGSSPGDWRLPTRAEWEATIAKAVALGCVLDGSGGPPSLTNDAGTACYGTGTASSFAGVASGLYWSSSASENFPSRAFAGVLDAGVVGVGILFKNSTQFSQQVWPVRGGTR